MAQLIRFIYYDIIEYFTIITFEFNYLLLI